LRTDGVGKSLKHPAVLVLRFEALSQDRLDEIRELVEKKVQEAVSALKGHLIHSPAFGAEFWLDSLD